MSRPPRELLPRLGRALRLGVALPIVASLAIGCATAPREEARDDVVPAAEHAAEVERLRRSEAEARRALDEARTETTLLRREKDRSDEERAAAQATARDHQVALDAALSQVRDQAVELEKLRTGSVPAGADDVNAVSELLRRQKQENDKLRAALADALAGRSRPAPDPALEGRVMPSGLDLEVEVATVDGEPITRRDFVEFLYRDLGSPSLLELCVNRVIVEREARRRGVEVSNVDVEVWITEQLVLHAREAGGEEKLDAKIAELGFDRRAWIERLRYQARPALLLRRLVELERTTPEGREAFEQRLQDEYLAAYSERVTASHIFIGVDKAAGPEEIAAARDKAAQAASLVRKGVPFVDVARRMSQDRETAKLGGTLGTFDRTRFARTPELNAALFTLAPGQVSDPVRSPLGFHVLFVDHRTPASRPFDAEVRSELMGRLSKEPPSDAELQALIARLRARAHVTRRLAVDDEPRSNPR